MAKVISKIAYLDGIRGVAALLVVFHHFLLAFYPAFYNYDLNATNLHGWDVKFGQSVFSVFANGNFCVCVFFVLSGFVLSRKYFQTQAFEVIVSGAQRRFLRLYIPVAATMIISYTLIKTHLYYNMPVSKLTHSEWWLGTQWTFDHPLQHLWMALKVNTMFLGDSAFDTSLWTMSIEFVGSLFVFAFLAFTHKTKNRFAAMILVLLYCKFTEQTYLAAFVFGISLNYIEGRVKGISKKWAFVIAILMLLVGLFLGSYPTNNDTTGTVFQHMPPVVLRYLVWYHVVGAYLLVTAFVLSVIFQHAISLRLFRFLGYVSFSLYLLHPLIIGSFSSYVFLYIYGQLGYNYSVLWVFALTIIFCLLLSWLMTKYIDDPGIRFSKYIYERWVRRSQEKPAEVPVIHDTE